MALGGWAQLSHGQVVLFEQRFDDPQSVTATGWDYTLWNPGTVATWAPQGASFGDGGLHLDIGAGAGNRVWRVDHNVSPQVGGRYYVRTVMRVWPRPSPEGLSMLAPGFYGTSIGQLSIIHLTVTADGGLSIAAHTSTQPGGAGVNGLVTMPVQAGEWMLLESWLDALGSADAGHVFALDGVIIERVAADWSGVSSRFFSMGQLINSSFEGEVDFDEVLVATAPVPSVLALRAVETDGGSALYATAHATFDGGFMPAPLPLEVQLDDGGFVRTGPSTSPVLTALDQEVLVLEGTAPAGTMTTARVTGRGLRAAQWVFVGPDAGEAMAPELDGGTQLGGEGTTPREAGQFAVGCGCSATEALGAWWLAVVLVGRCRRR